MIEHPSSIAHIMIFGFFVANWIWSLVRDDVRFVDNLWPSFFTRNLDNAEDYRNRPIQTNDTAAFTPGLHRSVTAFHEDNEDNL